MDTRQLIEWPVGLPLTAVVIDNESTGLDPVRHSLIEIAAVRADGSTFEQAFRPRPGAELDPRAMEVNGWKARGLDSLPLGYYEALEMFFEWLSKPLLDGAGTSPRKWVLAGQNPATVEYRFLARAWHDLCHPAYQLPLSHRTIDLHDRACVYADLMGVPMPEGGWASDRLCKLLGIPEEATPHRAMNGVLWEVAAFDKIGRFLKQLGSSMEEGAV